MYSLIGRRGEACTHSDPSCHRLTSRLPRYSHRLRFRSASGSSSNCRRVQNAACSAEVLKLVGSYSTAKSWLPIIANSHRSITRSRHTVGVRPVAHNVAETHDPFDAPLVNVGQHHLQRVDVAVDVGDDGGGHGFAGIGDQGSGFRRARTGTRPVNVTHSESRSRPPMTRTPDPDPRTLPDGPHPPRPPLGPGRCRPHRWLPRCAASRPPRPPDRLAGQRLFRRRDPPPPRPRPRRPPSTVAAGPRSLPSSAASAASGTPPSTTCRGLARSGVFTLATGAPRRVGFADAREFGWLGYTERHHVDAAHTVDRMHGLLAAADIPTPRPSSRPAPPRRPRRCSLARRPTRRPRPHPRPPCRPRPHRPVGLQVLADLPLRRARPTPARRRPRRPRRSCRRPRTSTLRLADAVRALHHSHLECLWLPRHDRRPVYGPDPARPPRRLQRLGPPSTSPSASTPPPSRSSGPTDPARVGPYHWTTPGTQGTPGTQAPTRHNRPPPRIRGRRHLQLPPPSRRRQPHRRVVRRQCLARRPRRRRSTRRLRLTRYSPPPGPRPPSPEPLHATHVHRPYRGRQHQLPNTLTRPASSPSCTSPRSPTSTPTAPAPRPSGSAFPKPAPWTRSLADDAIELIVNLTIPAVHAEVSLRCLDAGKHVYSEKPLAVTTAEGRAVLDRAAEKNLRVGNAPDTFLGTAHQACRRAIERGDIGTPRRRHRLHAHPRPRVPGTPTPTSTTSPAAGPCSTWGPYYLTALINMLGPVTRVSGEAGILVNPRTITSAPKRGTPITVNTPDHVAGTLRFEGGCLGTIVTSFATKIPAPRRQAPHRYLRHRRHPQGPRPQQLRRPTPHPHHPRRPRLGRRLPQARGQAHPTPTAARSASPTWPPPSAPTATTAPTNASPSASSKPWRACSPPPRTAATSNPAAASPSPPPMPEGIEGGVLDGMMEPRPTSLRTQPTD